MRGIKTKGSSYCRMHSSGVPPGYPPFFVPGCLTCEARKAAGKVTGNEPLPSTATQTVQRMNGGHIDWAKRKRQQEARKRFLAENKVRLP